MLTEQKRKHIANISISFDETMIKALKQMDDQQVKLLIVLKDGRFKGLLSIGDIQRAIIKNTPFDERIRNILRRNFVIADDKGSIENIRKLMIKHRAENMPIVNASGELVDVLFWDEVFDDGKRLDRDLLDIPAVIMAGGRGLRLKPLTNVIPKALIPVGEKTIIENIMERMNAIGIRRFYVTVNYKHEMISCYFDGVNAKMFDISFHREDRPLGTAGGLRQLREHIHSTFIISNCDIIIDQDYRDIYEYHVNNSNDITVVATIKHYSIPYGILESGEGGILTTIREKPEFTYMVNSGLYIMEPEMIDEIQKDSHCDMTDLIESVRNRGCRIGVFPVTEKSWFDIGEWNEYRNTLFEYEKRFRK